MFHLLSLVLFAAPLLYPVSGTGGSEIRGTIRTLLEAGKLEFIRGPDITEEKSKEANLTFVRSQNSEDDILAWFSPIGILSMQRRAEFNRGSRKDKVEMLFFHPDDSNAKPLSKEQWLKAVFPEAEDKRVAQQDNFLAPAVVYLIQAIKVNGGEPFARRENQVVQNLMEQALFPDVFAALTSRAGNLMLDAAKNQNHESWNRVRVLLNRHPGLVDFSNGGTRYTALMQATDAGDLEMVKFLCEQGGASVDVVVSNKNAIAIAGGLEDKTHRMSVVLYFRSVALKSAVAAPPSGPQNLQAKPIRVPGVAPPPVAKYENPKPVGLEPAQLYKQLAQAKKEANAKLYKQLAQAKKEADAKEKADAKVKADAKEKTGAPKEETKKGAVAPPPPPHLRLRPAPAPAKMEAKENDGGDGQPDGGDGQPQRKKYSLSTKNYDQPHHGEYEVTVPGDGRYHIRDIGADKVVGKFSKHPGFTKDDWLRIYQSLNDFTKVYEKKTDTLQYGPKENLPVVGIHDSEIMAEIQNPKNDAAFFVLPSQLNGAEYPNENHIVEEVEDYKYDNTGGPRGQLAVHPAVAQFVLDNAANDEREGRINAVREILAREELTPAGFSLKNGYLQMPKTYNSKFTPDEGAYDAEKWERYVELWKQSLHQIRLLMTEDVAVSGLTPSKASWTTAEHKVNLVYASAVPLDGSGYMGDGNPTGPKKETQKLMQKQIANLVLLEQYLAAMRKAAAQGIANGKKINIFLMPLGGGVFNNEWEDIYVSIAKAVELLTIEERGSLNIQVLTWAGNPGEFANAARCLTALNKYNKPQPDGA